MIVVLNTWMGCLPNAISHAFNSLCKMSNLECKMIEGTDGRALEILE